MTDPGHIEVSSALLGEHGLDWVRAHARNAYSQYGEDGLIAAIFERVGMRNRFVADIGCGDGVLFSNSRTLIEAGWRGLLIDADAGKVAAARAISPECVITECVTVSASEPARTLDAIFSRHQIPHDLDLMTLDIDGQDLHVWNQLLRFRPRVVVVEHELSPGKEWFVPLIDGDGQAGAAAIALVGLGKQYVFVARTLTNSLFIAKEVVQCQR